MLYTNRFIATDNLIIHLKPVVGAITDTSIKANYAGFLSVSAITVYELAIKDVFNEFAAKKNKVFGSFVEKHFSRINGKIKIEHLKGNHIKLFGEKYLKKFDASLKNKEDTLLTTSKISIKSSYDNLITCRHDYVHKGSPTLTINEVMDSYNYGKEVIHCLNEAMKR